MKLFFQSLATATLCSLLATPLFGQAEPEMRACWVSRFNWTNEGDTTEDTKERIRGIMETLGESNFNAVLFQVRGECDTLYPSPYEPWGPQFNWTDPGWDPFAFALEQAKANGLEFHAYINTHTLSPTAPPEVTTPQHQYNLHGPDAEDSWVIHDKDGKPVSSTDSYTWLSPGHPDASAWTRQAVMHVVENYDIDGVHFDRIRTPGEDFSYDPRTKERFAGDGNPDDVEWGDFMRAQITRDLRRIYGGIALRKPDIKLSTAPFGICKKLPGGYQGSGTESYYKWYQDTFGWMENGVVDAIFPMIYWPIDSAHPFEVLLADFLNHDGGRHVYAGISRRNDPIAQIKEVRSQQAPGSTIWSYGDGNFDDFVAGPYSQAAPVPPMPWKDNPKTAIVAGTITSDSHEPLLDAWVWVRGDDYTYLSGADGFYSILNLKPGTHTITVRKNGVGETVKTINVKAGDVQELNIVIPSGAHSLTYEGLTSAPFIEEMVALSGTDATRLHPEYVRMVLETRAEDKELSAAYARARAQGTDEAKQDLLRAMELKFVHDPAMSGLDLLGPELAEHFRDFDWQEYDYPGGTEGPNEQLADIMVDALDIIRPERRANRWWDAVVTRNEMTTDMWDYVLGQWEIVPGQENWKLNRHALKSFVRMREAARKDGIDLVIKSGHRDPERARRNAERAGNPNAVASFSAHSLGLAIDFDLDQEGQDYPDLTTVPMSDVVIMRESPVHKWLHLRGDEFGWYPFQHEPWHWEYNPPGFRPIFWKDYEGKIPERKYEVPTGPAN